jgi:hypothetical protein
MKGLRWSEREKVIYKIDSAENCDDDDDENYYEKKNNTSDGGRERESTNNKHNSILISDIAE